MAARRSHTAAMRSGGDVAVLGGFGFGEEGEAFGVAFEHGVQQGGGSAGGGLADLGHAGGAGQADITAIDREITGDGFEEGGFAGAVAADEADAPAGVDGEVRPFEEGAAAHAQGDGGDGEQAHGWRLCGAAR